MPWILLLEPFTECAHSVRKRTDTTLDQDCVLKATVQVCAACMVVSLLTTCMNFNTPPLAQIAPFPRLPTDSRLYNSKLAWTLGQLHLDHSGVSKRPHWLVYNHSHGPEKVSALSVILARPLSVILARHLFLKVVRQVRRPVNLHEIWYCLLLLLCSLLFCLLCSLLLALALLLAVLIRSS